MVWKSLLLGMCKSGFLYSFVDLHDLFWCLHLMTPLRSADLGSGTPEAVGALRALRAILPSSLSHAMSIQNARHVVEVGPLANGTADTNLGFPVAAWESFN